MSTTPLAGTPSSSSSASTRQSPLTSTSAAAFRASEPDSRDPSPTRSTRTQDSVYSEADSSRKHSRIAMGSGRKSVGSAASRESSSGSSQPGTFLTRFLGSFRPPGAGPSRPTLPRSLSSPIPLHTEAEAETERETIPSTPAGSSFLPVPGSFPLSPSGSSTLSLGKRLSPSSFRRSRSQTGSPKSSPSSSPAASPGLSSQGALSPGSPATLRGVERDPMDRLFAQNGGEGGASDGSVGRQGGMYRRGSVLSQTTLQGTDHAYPATTPLVPIPEPPTNRHPQLDSSLELIATLLPPALLLLSQLGPTHLFSPPLQLPSLFEVTLAASASRKSSISTASGQDAVLSSGASINSTATGSTSATTSTAAFHLPTTDHLFPSYTHELHAPSTLSVPAVSAAAIWRLFRGFEWIGEVGKGEQPLPPSPIPRHLGGLGGGPPLELDDEPEQIFDFPALLQGVSDVLAADAAARGIELVIGQVGSGGAPSPAATPGLMMSGKQAEPLGAGMKKTSENKELLVRADERAWSVTLIWILHHILAGATSGSNIDVRFAATTADPVTPAETQPPSPDDDDDEEPSTRPQKWWTVSVEIVHTIAPPITFAPPFPDETSAPPPPAPLPTPPFDTPFAQQLFSLVQLSLGSGPSETTSTSWVLETLLPAAHPRPHTVRNDPASLLGRRRASLDVAVGQEPSMSDLKKFAETALKGHRVALHSGETSTFAKHLTTYLAGWGMDVQHVPIEREALSSGSASVFDPRARPNAGNTRFDSGFETGTSPTGAETHGKSPEVGSGSTTSSGTNGEPASSLVIIDDDVATLRRLLVSLRAPPLHYAPTLMSKRPQLSNLRSRSSPHVRQLQHVQHQYSASQWVIVHFASLTNYKQIKEIVQDMLATSRSPSLPEVLVVPKPAGPRRIITAIWTALKRPAVDPSLPPIATSPTSPGIQYWTPRLSPALAKEHDFDFSSDSGSGGKASESSQNPASTLGKPRTPPIYYNASGQAITTGGLPPSPLGRMNEPDSYFSTVTEELKDTTASEGMIIQSPDGRAGIFFQPMAPKGLRSSHGKEKASGRAMEGDKPAVGDDILEEALDDSPPLAGDSRSETSSGPPSRLYTPLEMGLGSAIAAGRRAGSGSSNVNSGASSLTSVSIPPSTPALHLDSFITAAATGRPLTVEDDTEGPHGEPLSRQQSNLTNSPRSVPAPTRRSISNSSGSTGAGPNTTSPRTMPVSNPAFPLARRSTSTVPPAPLSPPSPTPGPAAAAGAAAAQAMAKNYSKAASPGGLRSRRGTVTSLPKNKRKTSRRSTLPAVPPISVLIVEDNPINQTILSVFMRKKGISYKVAKDGEQAVQMWKKGNFHLVLMDIQLPVKDGIEATREIREMERQNNIGTFITTPTSDLNSPMSTISSNPLSAPTSPLLTMPVIIVALTASSLQADRINALAAGCNDFLTKPVSLTWLESKLVEWGSMAYLSGFSRKSDSSDSSVVSISQAVTPSRPLSPAPVNTASANTSSFRAGAAIQADRISQHLHIDRQPSSRSSSPGLPPRHAITPPDGVSASQDSSEPKDVAQTARNPLLTFTQPTPQDTPGPVPAIPGATATPAPAAGGDASSTLAAVDEKLETLLSEQEVSETSVREHPARPGPTPLSQPGFTASSAELDDVMAEGNRLVEVSRGRSNSNSVSQALVNGGAMSATKGTDE